MEATCVVGNVPCPSELSILGCVCRDWARCFPLTQQGRRLIDARAAVSQSSPSSVAVFELKRVSESCKRQLCENKEMEKNRIKGLCWLINTEI